MADVKLTFEVSPDQADAMAEFCKRVYIESLRPLAATPAEAEDMFWGFTRLREALREKGYAPR